MREFRVRGIVNNTKNSTRSKLKELTDSCGLKPYMGELLVSELKKSKLPKDEKLKYRAKLLGLM